MGPLQLYKQHYLILRRYELVEIYMISILARVLNLKMVPDVDTNWKSFVMSQSSSISNIFMLCNVILSHNSINIFTCVCNHLQFSNKYAS